MTEKAVIVGGPEDDTGKITEENQSQATENKEENTKPPEKKKIKTASGREFNSVEEMQQYLDNLELTSARNQLQLDAANSNKPQPQPAISKKEEEELAELMYSDPSEYNKRMKAMVKREFEEQRNLETARDNFWKEFYENNSDLQKCSRIVQSIHKELSLDENFSRLTAKQGAEKIASEVRKALEGIANFGGEEQVVNGKPAPVISGNNPTPKIVTPEKPKTFLEQFKGMKAKRKAS